ncbi:MAG: ABC transporter permease [Candidatus Aminicenantes bacterium]|jgi:putative ABC transport system permease protein
MRKKPTYILEQLLLGLLKERDRESFLRDFEEIYLDIAKKRGHFYANIWYILQIFKSFAPALKNRLYWNFILFKNYLKIAFRNYLHHKGITLINIIGLSVGMGAFLIITLYTRYELTFDMFHKNSKNIYRIQYDYFKDGEQRSSSAWTVPVIGPALKNQFLEVFESARASSMFLEYSALSYKNTRFLEERVLFVTPSFLTMLTFPMVKGDPHTALLEPLQAVFTRSAADRYFGEEDPIGKTVVYNNRHEFLVSGVCADVPPNSHIKFDVLFSFKSFLLLTPHDKDTIESSWDANGFYTYIALKPGTDPHILQEKINRWVKKERAEEWKKHNIRQEFLLQPLEDIHLHSNLVGEMVPDELGNGEAVKVLTLIAFFILALAWLNYINISTSRAMERAKEVGVRKVSGAYRLELIRQFMVEYAGLSLLSVFLSMLIVFLALPFFVRLTGSSLPLNLLIKSGFWINLLGYFLAGTILSGLYPAVVLSSFKPASILKGSSARPTKGVRLRKFLIVFQLAVSVGLISGTFIVMNQIDYMMNTDLGFDMKKTLVIWGPGTNSAPPPVFSANFNSFRDDIKNYSSVLGFTTSTNIPGTEVLWGGVFRRLEDPPSKNVSVELIGIDYNHIPLFGVHLIAGRNFSKDFPADSRALILNEEAVRLFGYSSPESAINRKIVYRGREMTVIGTIDNYNQMSLKTIPKPLIYVLDENRGYISLKINTDNLRQTVAEIKKRWDLHFPGIPFNNLFLDEFFNRQYRDDLRFGKVFSLFSVLTIYIACLGLFALASLNAVQRTKEIGIRKALGASGRNIYVLLSKEFMKLVLFAGLLAVPLTYYKMSGWLSNFAFRITIQWWHFALPWVLVLIVVLATISYQTFQAAKTNPVEAIKYE